MGTEPVRKRKRKRTVARGTVQTRVAKEKIRDGKKITKEPSRMSRDFEVDLEDLQHVGSVAVGGGLTKNMKNFNSVKISVLINIPCDPSTDESFDRTKERASRLLDKYIDEEYRAAIEDDEFFDDEDEDEDDDY